MSDTTELMQDLNQLLTTLDDSQAKAKSTASVGAGDAISRELAREARKTEVQSLRDAPEIEAFRNELIDGLIREDTANQLLKLINEVVTRLM